MYRRARVAVAMSGGVDSSVAAWLMAQEGHEVLGVFMRNWDGRDDEGMVGGECPADREWADVKAVCASLPGHHPPPVEVNFVREYWTEVFAPFVAAYASGARTPNPDVACNRYIKFGALRDKARALGCDALATGHYARLLTPDWSDNGSNRSVVGGGAGGSLMDYTPADNSTAGADAVHASPRAGLLYSNGLHLPQLWSARDLAKDQSYFLSGVAAEQLVGVRFPLGDLASKAKIVRALAAEGPPGLAKVATKKDSVGLCFVGQKKRGGGFSTFLDQYLKPTPAEFVDIATGRCLGPAKAGLEAYTVGQGARISHDQQRTSTPPTINKAQRAGAAPPPDAVKWFVCGKDLSANAVLVCPGSGHPALYSDHLYAQPLVPLASLLHSRLRGSSSTSSNDGNSSSSSSSSEYDGDLHTKSNSNSADSVADNWLEPGHKMRCLFRVRHRQELAWATVTLAAKSAETEEEIHHSSSTWSSSNSNSNRSGGSDSTSTSKGGEGIHGGGTIVFDEPMRAVTAGQHVALYLPAHHDTAYRCSSNSNNSGNLQAEAPAAWTANGAQAYRCLGGGAIARAGPSYWAQEKALPADVKTWAMS